MNMAVIEDELWNIRVHKDLFKINHHPKLLSENEVPIVNQQFVSSTLYYFNDFRMLVCHQGLHSPRCRPSCFYVSMTVTSHNVLIVCTPRAWLVKFLLPQGRHFMVNSQHLLFADKLFYKRQSLLPKLRLTVIKR